MKVGITAKQEDTAALSAIAENMKAASRETMAALCEYTELAEKHGIDR